ncbi:MAG: response regulator transcription factor [Thermomicrobiales bacterium]
MRESPVIPQLLLVDDDSDLLLSLRLQLEADGFRVLTADSGRRALAIVGEVLPHLAVVDLMMPGIDGFEIARRLRQYADIPIIMLTAIDDPARKIAGLSGDADDYVTKPFIYGELLARIRNLLQRAWPQGRPIESTIIVDDLTIDFARRVIVAGSEERRLSPTEARLLHLLVKNRGQILPNDLLLDRLWPDGNGTMNSLWEYVRRLREKLGDTSDEPRYVASERGIGYRFLALT